MTTRPLLHFFAIFFPFRFFFLFQGRIPFHRVCVHLAAAAAAAAVAVALRRVAVSCRRVCLPLFLAVALSPAPRRPPLPTP